MSVVETTEAAISHRPPPSAHIAYLDGWRGLAIALVLEEHFFGVLAIRTGRLGVDIFFCLSGLLMSNILFLRRVRLATFYKRRFSRIYPAFLVFVLTVYVISWMQGSPSTFGELVSTLTFFRTYLPLRPEIWDSALPIGHLWSLNVEEHSYVFLSLLTLFSFARGREWIVLTLSGVACMLVHGAYMRFPAYAPHWTGHGTENAAAPLLISAGYSLCCSRVAPHIRGWMPLAALGSATVCYSDIAGAWSARLFGPFLLSFTANHLAQSPAWFRAALETRSLRLLGVWSFSIYLWQQPFFKDKECIPYGAPTALCLAILAGLASYYFLENPMRNWINKRW
jgi:peptidoglycan/LPS O-acetylase OafA/YrhL